MKHIAVYVEGGNVQSVIANTDVDISVEVFDVDNLKGEGRTDKQIEKLWAEKCKIMNCNIY